MMLPISTFVGLEIGKFLGKTLGATWPQPAFLILGSVAGFVGLIRQIMRDSNDDA